LEKYRIEFPHWLNPTRVFRNTKRWAARDALADHRARDRYPR
jgi:hypothetical protein